MRENRYFLPALNTIGYVIVIAFNALANILPIAGVTTGEVSDRYDNLFVPAGLTFSIWGVIYLLLAIFVVYQWVVARHETPAASFVGKVGAWFFVSCLANASWIVAWHHEVLPLTLVLMLVLLGSLLAIYLRLGTGVQYVTRAEQYFVHVPFSIYLGWITIATIANVSALLISIRWDTLGLGPQFWAVLAIAVGTTLALIMAFKRHDVFFSLVVVWALLGILLKRLADPTTPDQAVVAAAIAGITLVAIATIVQLVRKRVYQPAIT